MHIQARVCVKLENWPDLLTHNKNCIPCEKKKRTDTFAYSGCTHKKGQSRNVLTRHAIHGLCTDFTTWDTNSPSVME